MPDLGAFYGFGEGAASGLEEFQKQRYQQQLLQLKIQELAQQERDRQARLEERRLEFGEREKDRKENREARKQTHEDVLGQGVLRTVEAYPQQTEVPPDIAATATQYGGAGMLREVKPPELLPGGPQPVGPGEVGPSHFFKQPSVRDIEFQATKREQAQRDARQEAYQRRMGDIAEGHLRLAQQAQAAKVVKPTPGQGKLSQNAQALVEQVGSNLKQYDKADQALMAQGLLGPGANSLFDPATIGYLARRSLYKGGPGGFLPKFSVKGGKEIIQPVELANARMLGPLLHGIRNKQVIDWFRSHQPDTEGTPAEIHERITGFREQLPDIVRTTYQMDGTKIPDEVEEALQYFERQSAEKPGYVKVPGGYKRVK